MNSGYTLSISQLPGTVAGAGSDKTSDDAGRVARRLRGSKLNMCWRRALTMCEPAYPDLPRLAMPQLSQAHSVAHVPEIVSHAGVSLVSEIGGV